MNDWQISANSLRFARKKMNDTNSTKVRFDPLKVPLDLAKKVAENSYNGTARTGGKIWKKHMRESAALIDKANESTWGHM
jgi:hypothetical protein